MPDNSLEITSELVLPLAELQYRFARSGGPGGQHVNKSETQVELLWDVSGSPSLTEAQRALLLQALANRIDGDGTLHLVASDTRSQERNRQAVTKRFVQLLATALRPRRRRHPTGIPKAERARRAELKKRHSVIKRLRTKVPDES